MADELREKVAGAIKRYEREANTSFVLSPAERLAIANRILAIPEIAEALRVAGGVAYQAAYERADAAGGVDPITGRDFTGTA